MAAASPLIGVRKVDDFSDGSPEAKQLQNA